MAPKKEVTVFIPGYNTDADRRTLELLRENGPVLVLAQSNADLACGAQPGCWTLLAPNHPEIFHAAMLKAKHVISTLPGINEQITRLSVSPSVTEEPSTEEFAFCCVADTQYLPFFFALVDNLTQVHRGPLEIHLLAVDSQVEPLVRAQYPDRAIEIYSMQDVWAPQEWERISQRPISLQALSSKPRIFLKARQKSNAEALFLLDLDMYFFRSPARLNHEFDDSHTLFFPQWSDRFTWARLHGIFNSGMVGARKGAEPFIAWWSEACWISCELAVEGGRFGDQAFIDQAILYFDGIKIYRKFDEDVAPWNCRTLGVSWENATLSVLGNRPVGSFHAAGPDEARIFETKYLWDQLVSVFSVIDNPNESRALFKNVLEQQRLHWPALNRALMLRHLAKARTRLPVSEITPDWAARAVGPVGDWVLQILSSAHGAYRWWRGHDMGPAASGADKEYDFWVELQRKALFSPDQLLTNE